MIKKIKSCKSTNFEKSIRVNGYIDHNEEKTQNETILRCPTYISKRNQKDYKMTQFSDVQHTFQKVIKTITLYIII